MLSSIPSPALAGLVAVAATGLLSACAPDDAGEGGNGDRVVEVAAAANLAPVMDTLAAAFTDATGIPVRVSLAATGQLYAQIRSGAPFHVLLAADEERPRLLEEERLAVRGSRFTYVRGRLVLYAPGEAPRSSPPWGVLRRPEIRLAVANPRTAPYGTAALQALEALREAGDLGPLSEGAEPPFVMVMGENVGQAFQFVRSGAADAGFVALSQVVGLPHDQYLVVPLELYEPVRQDAVLLAPAAAHAGARRFLEFLAGDEARMILARFGYPDAMPGGGGS